MECSRAQAALPWPVAYWILKVALSPILYLFWRVEVEGRDHVPARGPAIMAANHQSFCDSLFLPLVLRRRVTYVAKSEYFDDPKTAWFFRAAGQIPMHRGGGDRSQLAMDTAKEVLAAGHLLGIYPEGTRSPDTRVHRGHTGVARLAFDCEVPVIPVGIIGTRSVQPPGCRLMRPFHSVKVRFGSPLTFGLPATDRPADPSAAGSGSDADQGEFRKMTDTVMAAIAELSGKEYVDRYASRSKAPRPAGTGTVDASS
ncbi:MAG: lysophospholipid acyltransferase family protein [Acidimicrobiales bacterium]